MGLVEVQKPIIIILYSIDVIHLTIYVPLIQLYDEIVEVRKLNWPLTKHTTFNVALSWEIKK